MHKYRRKTVIFLMGYLIIFFIVLLVSVFNLNRGKSIFDIGMNPSLQNWIIIILSVLAIIRVVMEIARIENHSEYEKKLRDMRQI